MGNFVFQGWGALREAKVVWGKIQRSLGSFLLLAHLLFRDCVFFVAIPLTLSMYTATAFRIFLGWRDWEADLKRACHLQADMSSPWVTIVHFPPYPILRISGIMISAHSPCSENICQMIKGIIKGRKSSFQVSASLSKTKKIHWYSGSVCLRGHCDLFTLPLTQWWCGYIKKKWRSHSCLWWSKAKSCPIGFFSHRFFFNISN